MIVMSQQKIEALLGRSLTAKEVSNLALYLEIAIEQLKQLLCMDIEEQTSSGIEEETRVFDARSGMQTVFTGIFSAVSDVTVNGVSVDYTPYFFDNRNSDYFNSIVLSEIPESEVSVTAEWGFSELPKDIQRLIAQMFAVVSKKRSVSNIKSKKVEDFSVTYGDLSDFDAFVNGNAITINKYSLCEVKGSIRSGETC